MLKDILYIGLGSALLAKEKVEEELNKLVEKGKLSKEDAKKFVDNAKKRGEEEEKKAKDEFKKVLTEILQDLEVATKKDIEDLKKSLKGE